MRLYHDPVSTTCRPVTFFAAEAEIELDLVYIDLASGEQHGDEFGAISPQRQVPVLDDDGFILTESATILRYLAERYAPAMAGSDTHSRARVSQWLDWFNTSFAREAAHGLVYPLILPGRRLSHEPSALQLASKARQTTEGLLAILDRQLAGKRFVTADEISIADFLGASYVSLLEVIGFDLRPYPEVSRWIAAMRRLPGWSTANAAFEGRLAAQRTKPANAA
jgi:glutathione S-transferase